MSIRNLEKVLGIECSSPALYQQALTHRSAGPVNYERLEFLGDALVDLFAAELLYQHFPNADEGELSRVRASLIAETGLADIARDLQIGELIRLGNSERRTGGWHRASIQADVLEALVAATYLDRGFAAAQRLVRGWLQPRIDAIESLDVFKDAKTRLQEWLQGRRLPLPVYELLGSTGADHEKVFTVACQVATLELSRSGTASSRRAAEQLAAVAMLQALKETK